MKPCEKCTRQEIGFGRTLVTICSDCIKEAENEPELMALWNEEDVHTNCIPRASLPELPSHYVLPFKVHHHDNWGPHCWQVTDQDTQLFAECESKEDADRLTALLNAAYPAPAEGGE